MENKNCCGNCCWGDGSQRNWVCSALIIFLIVGSLVAIVWGWSVLKKTGLPAPGSPMLFVSAEGRVTVVPDLVKINFSVVSQGEDYSEIQRDNDSKMKEATDYLKEEGVEEKDIKTVQYNLSPQYDYSWCRQAGDPFISCSPRISGYQITQQVEVKIRDLSKAGSIAANLPEKGINQINSLVFTVDDLDLSRAEARNEAIMKAREKAISIAASSGIKLGKVVNFSESDLSQRDDRIFTIESAGLGKGGGGDIPPSPLQAGSQDVVVYVNMSFEIR